MKKKRNLYTLMLASMLLVFGCEGEPPLVTAPVTTISDVGTPLTEFPIQPLTDEQALAVAGEYYPSAITLVFDRLAQVDGAECYLFSALRGDEEISQVAVSRFSGKLWFRNWQDGTESWLKAEDLEPLTPLQDVTEQEGHLDYTPLFEADGGSLSFTNLDTVPEFTAENTGIVTWNAEKETLRADVMIITGTVNGELAGPGIHFTAAWRDGKSFLEAVSFDAAPKYTHPAYALESLNIVTLEIERVLEIAAYFRALIDSIDAPN